MQMTDIAIIGAGPAGLMAADRLYRNGAGAGRTITVYDRMRRPGRKFLLAGRGGLNLTNAEPLDAFLDRYPQASARDRIARAIAGFTPDDLRAWAGELGVETFVGTSQRIFPKELKASPMLRAWLRWLDVRGVRFAFAHRWCGFAGDGGIVFETPDGETSVRPDATLLALGGASWPRLGSDGAWRETLLAGGVAVADLEASNCGVLIGWSDLYRERFHGVPLKRVAVTMAGDTKAVRGDLMVTRRGLEGGPVYALGPALRASLQNAGVAQLTLDLRPDVTADALAERLAKGRAKETLTNALRKRAALQPAAINLLREARRELPSSPTELADLIKAVPLDATGLMGLDRAISTAGGVIDDAISDDFSLVARPDVFVAGEMIDWDAPTGGYLLQACFATGVAAADGIAARLTPRPAD
jgi:uncharacterized flavoprotein (TIGR03862 family)